jgi:nicotinate-nucleotide pyrophosphorylase
MHRELREKEDLLNRRRECKKGKRVALKGKFLLSKDEILEVVKNIEKEVKEKKSKKGKNKKIEVIISLDSEEEESLDELA